MVKYKAFLNNASIIHSFKWAFGKNFTETAIFCQKITTLEIKFNFWNVFNYWILLLHNRKNDTYLGQSFLVYTILHVVEGTNTFVTLLSQMNKSFKDLGDMG